MKFFQIAASLIALGLPTTINATTISFDGFASDQVVDQSYGDIAGVMDVTYAVLNGGDNWGTTAAVAGGLPIFWADGYSGITADTGALVGPNSSSLKIQVVLQALGSSLITSFGINIGYWLTTTDLLEIRSYDQNGNQIFAFNNTDTPGLVGVSSLLGAGLSTVVIQMGDSWNTGFQNIDYELNTPSAVPLPAAGWLLLAGVGGIAALRRRKTV